MALTHFPPECATFRDARTGAVITRWTSHPAMHHHFYFTSPTFSHDGAAGCFVSYRTGYPNLFTMALDGGQLTQLTDRIDINPFSPAPSPRAPHIYFSARQSVWQVDTTTGDERELARFPGARMGNCSLNHAGTRLAVSARYASRCDLCLIDLDRGDVDVATSQPEIGHIQFSPRDDRYLIYSGPVDARIWRHDRIASTDDLLYPQKPGEWIVHETWRAGPVDEVIFPCWPHRLCAIRRDGCGLRTIAEVNAWHVASGPRGRTLVCDTNHPDRGLLLISADTGAIRTLCHPQATCRGTQWKCDTPARGAGIDTSILRSDTPENDPPPHPADPPSTYGPQWSHPHPSFAPDAASVVYTSDRGGYSHVYSVALPEDDPERQASPMPT